MDPIDLYYSRHCEFPIVSFDLEAVPVFTSHLHPFNADFPFLAHSFPSATAGDSYTHSETEYNWRDVNIASNFIIFVASGLLVYWAFRVRTILHGDSDAIEETLDLNVWRGRRLLLAIRSMFDTPTQLC